MIIDGYSLYHRIFSLAIIHNMSSTIPQMEELMMIMIVFVSFGLARRSKPGVGLQVRKVALSMFVTNIYF